MNEILKDLSDGPVTDANLENVYASSPFYYDIPGKQAYAGKDVSWVMTDIPFIPCNIVFKARMSSDTAERTVADIVSRAQQIKTPLRWYMDSKTTPGDLGDILVKYGFAGFNRPSPLMAVDVDIPEPEALQLASMQIVEVSDKDELKLWNHIATTGFGGNAENEVRNIRWFNRVIDYGLPARFYLAYVDGVPAATSQLVPAAGVGGVFYVATLPEFRNKGLGYTVTLKAVKDAGEMGYRVATLQASMLGEPVYRRMGWWKSGETMVYQWNPML